MAPSTLALSRSILGHTPRTACGVAWGVLGSESAAVTSIGKAAEVAASLRDGQSIAEYFGGVSRLTHAQQPAATKSHLIAGSQPLVPVNS